MNSDKQANAASERRKGRHPSRRAVAFGGPTASGKSAAALATAKEFGERGSGAVVINADSMQVYRELAILTARPDAAAMAAVPHRLYGVLSAGDACSAGRWCALALAEIDAALAAGKLPILAGGTGLYLEALQNGLVPVPAIPDDVREQARALLLGEDRHALHARLARIDPAAAAALRPGDRQRIVRAWEVMMATGRSILEWRREVHQAENAPELTTFLFLPERQALYAACDRRFEQMIEAGAIGEVKALLALGLDPGLPAMKAVGVREIAAYLRGEIGRAEMIARGQQATRNYAKRQYTWFRRRVRAVGRFDEQYSERMDADIFKIIRESGLTL